MMAINREGIESDHVLDAAKIVCPYCGGVKMMLTTLMDDPNDITEDTDFAALLITIGGGSIQGLVALCVQCGHEHVPYWRLQDTGANTGAATTMTNLDQATTANLLVGLYMIPMVGSDIGKYFIIASNTAAAPTIITTTVAPNDDSDGLWILTNILPLGLTVGS